MATQAQPASQRSTNGSAAEFNHWQSSTRVVLQPLAAPSILGLFGFAAATFMVSTNLAGWYGNPKSALYIFPFAAIFGGIAQFMAGMWAFKARDAIATAMHGMWGSFWIAYGILFGFVAAGAIAAPVGKVPALGFWFFPLAAITLAGAVAAIAENIGLTGVLASLGTGSAFLAIGYVTGIHGWISAGGWVLFASSVIAFYTASAMMLRAAYGRVLLPVGETSRRRLGLPGAIMTHPIEYGEGEPGIKQGQ